MSNNLACARARVAAATSWLTGYDPGDGHGVIGEQAVDPMTMFTQPVVIAAFVAGAEHATEACGVVHRAEQDEWTIERATGQRQLDDAAALMREAAELFRTYEAHHREKMAAIEDDTSERVEAEQKVDRNALAAARLEAWLEGKDSYPVSMDPEIEALGRIWRGEGEEDEFSGSGRVAATYVEEELTLPVGARKCRVCGCTDVTPCNVGASDKPDGWVSCGWAGPSLCDNPSCVMAAATVISPGVAGRAMAEAADLPEPHLTRTRPSRREPAFEGGECVLALSTPDPRFDPARPVTVNGFGYRPTKEA